jgi:hypothetical protein
MIAGAHLRRRLLKARAYGTEGDAVFNDLEGAGAGRQRKPPADSQSGIIEGIA